MICTICIRKELKETIGRIECKNLLFHPIIYHGVGELSALLRIMLAVYREAIL